MIKSQPGTRSVGWGWEDMILPGRKDPRSCVDPRNRGKSEWDQKMGKIECVFRIDRHSEKKRRNGNRRAICNATGGIDAGRGVIRHRGVSDGSHGAHPLWRSHSARTEMIFADVVHKVQPSTGRGHISLKWLSSLDLPHKSECWCILKLIESLRSIMTHPLVEPAPGYGVLDIYSFCWYGWWCSSLYTFSGHQLSLARIVLESHIDCCLGISIHSDVLFLIDLVVLHLLWARVGMGVSTEHCYHLWATYQSWIAVYSGLVCTMIWQTGYTSHNLKAGCKIYLMTPKARAFLQYHIAHEVWMLFPTGSGLCNGVVCYK